MNPIKAILKKPVWSIAFWMIVIFLGVRSYFMLPVDLFPDTTPPQIVVMTSVPGMSANDINRKVTTLIDREIKGLTGLKKVLSTSKDQISSVNAQFEYGWNLGRAMNDVINAVSKVKSKFPEGTLEPQMFRVTDANRPLLTLSVSPKPNSDLSLTDVRLLADNDIKEFLLRCPGVGSVDVFGANQPEVLVRLDLDKLRHFKLQPAEVLYAIGANNTTIPGGFWDTNGRESLVKTLEEAKQPDELANLPIKTVKDGIIRVCDVASVSLSVVTPRSIYHGDGKPAIALNVLKPEGGNSMKGIQSVKKNLPRLQAMFPTLKFSITTDQQPIIDVNIKGMKGALFSAIWLTMVIVFLFLVEIRTSIIIGISIPLAFLTALGFTWFTPFTMNMVILSGLIIAVGMVVDASIVVVENNFRHMQAKGAEENTVANATSEVVFSILGGMLTTVAVMIPIMFVGGYPQQVLRPLTMTISATLIGSFIAALTVVPLLLKKFFPVGKKLKEPGKFANFVTYILDGVAEGYLSLLRIALKARVLFAIIALIALLFSIRFSIGLVGRELMPRMDTGQVNINVDLPPSLTKSRVETILSRIEKIIYKCPHVLNISTVAGSEPGQVSFGAGGQLLQQANIQVRMTTRDKRTENIWEIMQAWRNDFDKIEGPTAISVTEYGATPLSTTKAPIDVLITGRDPLILASLGEKVKKALKVVPGLRDIRPTWSKTKPETNVLLIPELISKLNLSAKAVGQFIGTIYTGRIPAYLKLTGYLDIPIRVDVGYKGERWNKSLDDIAIPTPKGDIFLSMITKKVSKLVPTLYSRENLQQTLEILAINSVLPLSTVAKSVEKQIAKIKTPSGYKITLSGTMADMKDTAKRLAGALVIGLIMLYIVLWVMFETWWQPFLVMTAIPLSLIGAFWGLVIMDKPMCMPAMMGIILLGGTIVNNAIILIDFIEQARKSGLEKREAIFQSVRIRLRPILITTGSTILGLIPLTLEQAVGLERMSPLGVVASFGLMFGTVMTMVVIPMFYDLATGIGEFFTEMYDTKKEKKKNNVTKSAITVALILAIGFSSQQAFAQETNKKLTVQQCVNIALKKSPAIQLSDSDKEIEKWKLSEIKSAYSPQLSTKITYRKWDQDRMGFMGISPRGEQFTDDQLTDMGLYLRQLIWDNGLTHSRLKAQRLSLDSKVARKERIKREVVTAVYSVSANILSLKSQLKAADMNIKDVKAALKRVKELNEVGRVPRVDVLRIEVRLQESLEKKQTLQQHYETSLAQLAQITGLDYQPTELIASGLPDVTEISAKNPQELIKLALNKREDLKASRITLKSLKSAEKSQSRALGPKLSFMASGDRYGDHTGWGLYGGFAGVELGWTLSDGNRNRSKVKQISEKARAAAIQLHKTELLISKQVRSEFYAQKTALIRVKANEKKLKLAEEAHRIELDKYNEGRGTINDLLDSESALFAARALNISSKNDLLISQIALSLATGDLDNY